MADVRPTATFEPSSTPDYQGTAQALIDDANAKAQGTSAAAGMVAGNAVATAQAAEWVSISNQKTAVAAMENVKVAELQISQSNERTAGINATIVSNQSTALVPVLTATAYSSQSTATAEARSISATQAAPALIAMQQRASADAALTTTTAHVTPWLALAGILAGAAFFVLLILVVVNRNKQLEYNIAYLAAETDVVKKPTIAISSNKLYGGSNRLSVDIFARIGIDHAKMVEVAQKVLSDEDLTHDNFTPKDKCLSEKQFVGLQYMLVQYRAAEWINDNAHTAGVRLTVDGMNFFISLAGEMPATTPPPEAEVPGEPQKTALEPIDDGFQPVGQGGEA
jgi:hypothetical protein